MCVWTLKHLQMALVLPNQELITQTLGHSRYTSQKPKSGVCIYAHRFVTVHCMCLTVCVTVCVWVSKAKPHGMEKPGELHKTLRRFGMPDIDNQVLSISISFFYFFIFY